MTIMALMWLGFLVCLGLLLSARIVRSSFQKRMQTALNPTDDDLDELMQEQLSLIHI